jgi:coenzyme F420 hydrogenase subunit beta
MGVITKGCKELIGEIIETGLCTLCGACTGGCPYLAYFHGRIVLLDNCSRTDEAQCYEYCPRTFIDMNVISKTIFGTHYEEYEIGPVKDVVIARTTDKIIQEKAQYGGAVTVLLSLALSEGLIDGAILTKTMEDKVPTAFLAENSDDMLRCAGSSYMACPVLERLNRVPKDSTTKFAIVATPCQVLSLAKMKSHQPENRVSTDNIKLIIGLFCTWALSPEKFHRFLKDNLDLAKVKKFDIPPPPANRLDAYTSDSIISFPLEQIRKFTMPTCSYCLDMTSEFADISVGSVEGMEGWNTIIVRTDAGVELMKMAENKKKLQIERLPESNLKHLKEAALIKKRRSLAEIVKRTGNKNDMLYLGLSLEMIETILS